MRKRSNVVAHGEVHGEVHGVDHDRDLLLHNAHQQLQPLPGLQEQEWHCLACLQKNIFPIPYCDECIECLVRD